MKNKSADKFAYGVLLTGLILATFFLFRITNYGRTKLARPLENIVETAYDYIQYVAKNEQTIVEKCCSYFNSQCNYTIDEIKNNEEMIIKLIDDFNLLFIDPDNSYVILNDGTCYCSSNGDTAFVENHDLVNEYSYTHAIAKFGLSITPYNKSENDKIIYSYPLLDKYNNNIGAIVKTRQLDYLLSQIEQMDLSLFEYTIVISTVDDKPLAIIDEDGVMKGTDLELISSIDKLKKKTRGTIKEKIYEDYGLKFTFIPSNDGEMIYYNVSSGVSEVFLILFIVFIILTIANKRTNFNIALPISIVVVTINIVVFMFAFTQCYSNQVMKDVHVSTNIARMKTQNDEDIQDLLLNFTGTLLYNELLNVDLSNENAMNNIKNKLWGYEDLDLLQFMSFDNAYIMKDDMLYNLVTGEVEHASGNMIGLYESSLRNQKILDKHIYIDYINKQSETIKTYTMKYKEDSIVFALSYNSLAKDEEFYQDFIFNENIDELYNAVISDEELYIAPCKLSKKSNAVSFKDLKYSHIKNQEMYEQLLQFKNSKDSVSKMKFIISNETKTNALIIKSFETNNIFIVVLDLPAIAYTRNKAFSLFIGSILVILACIILKRNIAKYYENKKEGIQLHGNY